ncbi:hypothetical protein GCM10027277_46760 [Pseudoduganella ginsengisoli]|uniref:Uncharacterized protein n=1 Tax=Pseudoduganella ginsengisoli TaxID=1462440 RepID=A0A6L6Q2S5_9BURK|nr:hypothetical protein [Pseudoduganella ginsengisoli]MTW04137.1 hypothetical protein [Pseudoduganella ginsengisoli]
MSDENGNSKSSITPTSSVIGGLVGVGLSALVSNMDPSELSKVLSAMCVPLALSAERVAAYLERWGTWYLKDRFVKKAIERTDSILENPSIPEEYRQEFTKLKMDLHKNHINSSLFSPPFIKDLQEGKGGEKDAK